MTLLAPALLLGLALVLAPACGESEVSAARARELATAVRGAPLMRGLALQAQLREIRTAVNWYFVERGELPGDHEGLHALADAGLIDARKLVDPWGPPLHYRVEEGPETTFLRESSVYVWSAGPNGISEDGDDIGLQ